MMVAEVMVTVGKAAARAAVVAALYNVLSADAPVGAPPEGNAKEITRRRRRVTTTVSSNDEIMATGSLPAALSLPAAISSGCARLTPPCATALLDLRCTLGALVAPRLRHRLDRHAIARAATTGAHKAVPAADLRRCVHGLAMCSAVAWHERSR